MSISPCRGLWLLLSLFPAAAYADPGESGSTASVPVMTVTATRVSTQLPDTPGGVTVITAREMQQRGDTTLVQALAEVPGMQVVQSGGAGNQASVFMRGANSEDVLVLLDGVPVNDPSDPNEAFNFGDYTISDVARIEIVRGPMSGLYGSNAIGGVINIITLRGAGAPRITYSAAGGFPGIGQGGATLAGATGPIDFALTASDDQEAGFDHTARRLSVYDGKRDPYRAALGSIDLGYSPMEGTRIGLQFRAQRSEAAFPDLGYPIFDDPNEWNYNTNLFGKLGIVSDLWDGRLTTQAFIARIQNNRHVSNLLDANDPNGAAADDHYHGTRTDAQWNNTLHLPDVGPAALSSLLFGVEYTADRSKYDLNELSGLVPFTGADNHTQHTIAGHVGMQTTLANRLALTAALRDDAASSFGNAVTGRVGGVLAVPEADLHLKGSYGTGFLAPSLFDLYGREAFGGYQAYAGNPNLKPERSSGFDAGAQFDIPAFGQGDFASLSVSYFQNSISGLISPTSDFSSVENIGHARVSGVETELVLTPLVWATADLSYTYTYARDLADDTPLLRRPENAGSAVITLQPTPRMSIVPQLRYIGRFQDYLYADNGYPLGDGLSRPGTIVDLSASYAITPQFSLFARAENLFQSKFEPVNGLQIPGQSFLFGIHGSLGA